MLFQRRAKRIAAICAATIAVCLLALVALEGIVFLGGESFDEDDGAEIYYPGTADFGLLLCADRTQNRTALLRLSRAFGAPVLLTGSDGLGAAEIERRCELLRLQSGLDETRIFVVAADRAAAAVLDWSTHPGQPAALGAALVCPELDALPYQSRPGESAGALLVLEHAGEPNSGDQRAVALYNLLTGDTIAANGRPLHTARGNVSIALASAPSLSEATPSDALLDELSAWISRQAGVPAVKNRAQAVKTPLWLLGSAALLGELFLLSLLCRNAYEGASGVVSAEVSRRWLFFLGRAALWIAALPLFGVIYLVLHLTGAPLGVGGRLFVSYLLGCSLTTGLLYHTGMIGVKGSPSDIRPVWSARGIWRSTGLLASVLLTGGIFAATGFWCAEITADRLILFAGLWIALSAGMLAMMKDALMLSTAAHREETIVLLLLIPYLPLLIPAALALPMGLLPVSISLVRMFAALVASILCAKCVRELSGSALFAALCGALPFALFAAFQLEL